MLQVIAGVGLIALVASLFSEGDESPKRRRKKSTANREKKVFISFAIEDRKYRDFLVSQGINKRSPFSFADMSVRNPWTQVVWKRKCREKIRECDGVIVLLSKNTWHSGGTRWEIKCAREERVPVIGMHIKKNEKGAKPPELNGKKIIEWSWDNLDEAIKNF